MVDDNYKADSPDLEVNPSIDESKLNDREKEMLAHLRESDASPAQPPGLAEVEQEVASAGDPSGTVMESSDSGMEPAASGKVAEPLAAPFPDTEKVSGSSLPEPPPPVPVMEDDTADSEDLAEEPLAAGQDAPIDTCPHCNWDLSKQTIAEPEHDEKMGVLHSVLGQKPFIQQYELFGGQVIVRFRTLTTKEMDVIYNFVFKQREAGEISTIQDYWEKVNRYRLYLQLTYLSAADGSFTHTLPDSYSKETNPHSEEFWLFPAYDPDLGYLDQIEEKILKDVLRTETIQRTISTYCARFNRLVSKLEVMIDNPDFWKETEQQS